jgi:predicted alpha/beta superfamily hydrolase
MQYVQLGRTELKVSRLCLGTKPQSARWVALAAAALFAGAPCQRLDAAGATAVPCISTATGDLRLHPLTSAIFGNTRTIRVLLPAGYDAPENALRKYPVLYLLDGQNLFDACLSDLSHREWGVDETVGRLIAAKSLPALIVVGVDNAGANRAREFLPYKDFAEDPDMADPAGKRFPEFLGAEVTPLVNSHYRTLRGRTNTGIGGSSYGGVAALYALLARPKEFGFALVESPTLWVGMGQLVRDTYPLTAFPVRVYFGAGGRESNDPRENERLIALIRVVVADFRAAGYDDRNLRFVLDPQAAHNEDAWAQRLPGALRFLFGDWQEPPSLSGHARP